MPKYIKTHIHQLFPCPPNLTVKYKPSAQAFEAYENNKAFCSRGGVEPSENCLGPYPDTYDWPVVAYAVLDLVTYRSPGDVEIGRRRAVEPLIYIRPDSYFSEDGPYGTVALSDYDPHWCEAEPLGDYYYAGIFQNGKPLGEDTLALPITP